jgi:hypothetical protein
MKIGLKLVFLLLLSGSASASEIEISTGVVCKTEKQMQRFVSLSEVDPQTAAKVVNEEEKDPTACGVASLAFVRGPQAVTVRTAHATFQIAKILVVGVVAEGFVRPIAPSVQFSLFTIDERMA